MKPALVLTGVLFLWHCGQAQTRLPSTALPRPTAFQPVSIGGTQSLVRTRASASHIPAVQQADVRRQAQQRREYEALMADARASFDRPRGISYSLPSHSGEPGAAYYQQAFEALNTMLTGKEPLSLKKAVFLVENAYLDNKMDYQAFNSRIQNYAAFCRLKMQQEKNDTTSDAVKNDILFRLMSDTLTVVDPVTKKKLTHYPVHYDFDDFYGHKDWTKMFVTKLMNSNYGQCHSMPLLYSIIADEIGAKAYLSTSPSHLFVKYKRSNEWVNVELTNGHLTTDAYVMASGYIKSEALKNRIYLDTLSPRQEIAMLMQDLAKGYGIKYGCDFFVLQCCNTALRYYPNDAYGMAIKSDYSTALFQHVVSQKKGQTAQQVLSDPLAHQLYKQMHGAYDALDNSGYAQMPAEAYEEWLRSIDKEKRRQEYDRFLRYQKSTHSTIKASNAGKK